MSISERRYQKLRIQKKFEKIVSNWWWITTEADLKRIARNLRYNHRRYWMLQNKLRKERLYDLDYKDQMEVPMW